jgi:hypothetical protein
MASRECVLVIKSEVVRRPAVCCIVWLGLLVNLTSVGKLANNERMAWRKTGRCEMTGRWRDDK